VYYQNKTKLAAKNDRMGQGIEQVLGFPPERAKHCQNIAVCQDYSKNSLGLPG
jgi:hypothetical protein